MESDEKALKLFLLFFAMAIYGIISLYRLDDYSPVPNNRPPRLLIFEKFSNPPPALIPTPPFINFWKNEMIFGIISV